MILQEQLKLDSCCFCLTSSSSSKIHTANKTNINPNNLIYRFVFLRVHKKSEVVFFCLPSSWQLLRSLPSSNHEHAWMRPAGTHTRTHTHDHTQTCTLAHDTGTQISLSFNDSAVMTFSLSPAASPGRSISDSCSRSLTRRHFSSVCIRRSSCTVNWLCKGF